MTLIMSCKPIQTPTFFSQTPQTGTFKLLSSGPVDPGGVDPASRGAPGQPYGQAYGPGCTVVDGNTLQHLPFLAEPPKTGTFQRFSSGPLYPGGVDPASRGALGQATALHGNRQTNFGLKIF